MCRYSLPAQASLIWICLATVVLSGCHNEDADNSSISHVKAAVPTEPFDAVTVDGGGDVVIEIENGKPRISIFGKPDAVKRIQTKIDGGRLVIGQDWQWGSDADRAMVTVSMPSLKSIVDNGSGHVRVVGLKNNVFYAVVNGTGTMSIEGLKAKTAQFKLAGAGKVVATGSVATVRYNVMGTGSTDAHALVSDNATVEMNGTGDLSLAARSQAYIKVLGTGMVRVTGGARCIKEDLQGDHVDCR